MRARNVLILILSLLILAACRQQPSTQRTEPATPTSPAAGAGEPALTTPTTAAAGAQPERAAPAGITTLHWYVAESLPEQEWQRQFVIPHFEELHPEIQVELIVASREEFDSRLLNLIAAGDPPDIWTLGGRMGFADYQARGLVANLSPFIAASDFDLSDFSPATLQSYTFAGQLYGLPMTSTGSFIFYNRALFDAAGQPYPPSDWDDPAWTWQAFTELCQALTSTAEQGSATFFGCELAFWPNEAYTWLWGQPLYPPEARQGGFSEQILLDSPPALAAFQAYQDLVWQSNAMPNPAQSLALSTRGGPFESGRVAMYLTGGWGWWNFQRLEFDWGVAALPAADPERRTLLYTYPWLLSSRSDHPDQAWAFLSYLASAELQRQWMQLSGAPPARLSLVDEWASFYPELDPAVVRQLHLGALEHGVETPSHLLVEFEHINQAMQTCLAPIFNRQTAVAELLPDCDAQVEAVLQEIQAKYR